MAPHVEKLPVPLLGLGEGPHWDSQRQTLYYVDIPRKRLQRYVPATKEHAQSKVIDTEYSPNFIIPLVGHQDLFAVGIGNKVNVMRWDGQNDTKVDYVKVIVQLDVDNPRNSINDAKVGPNGKLYTGTIGMGPPVEGQRFNFVSTGAFYSITEDGVATKLDTGITLSNGLAFDPKKKAVYHIDTFGESIRRFDYEIETGESSNKKVIFKFTENGLSGKPDGMTIDTSGNLWVANFTGSNVLKICPDTGKVLRTVQIPDKEVTSVTFGGPNLDVLFVTTGQIEDPNGGATYSVTGLGVRGFENLPFNYKGL